MRTPRLFIDARMVSPIPHGFSRYVTRMIEGLDCVRSKGELPYSVHFLVAPSQCDFVKKQTSFECLPVDAPFLSPREWIEIPGVLSRNAADLYHSPTFSSLPLCPCPTLVTIHDLNHLTYGGLKEKLYYRSLLKRFARRSSLIMTVSEFSQNELAQWLGVPRSSIDVVPNAIDEEWLQEGNSEEIESVLASFGLKRGKFFVSMSNPKPHKNLRLLLDAYRDYRSKVGRDAAWPLLLTCSGLPEEDGVMFAGGLADQQGKLLVKGAGALVFPSLYEGFGLPPVEAAIAGVPVIVSEIPPHREGLKELAPSEALWVDPRDKKGWVRALVRASGGGGDANGATLGEGAWVRPSLRARKATLEAFSVQKMGENLDRVYRRVLGMGHGR